MSLFLDLRKHGKLAEKRNPMYEKSKFGKFWMYFMFVFWAGYLIFFGTTFAFAFDGGATEAYHVMNSGLIFVLVLDFLIRLPFQKTPTQEVKPYLLLPIKRNRLIDFLLIRSGLDGFNLFWLFLFVPFSIITVTKFYGIGGVLTYCIGIWLLMIFNNYWFLLCRTLMGERIWWLALPVVVYGGIAAALFIPDNSPLFDCFVNLGEGFITGNILSFIGVLAAIALMWFINRTLMQKLIYNELNKVEDTRIKHVSEYKFLDRYGEIGEYMRLELKLLLRNKICKRSLYSITGVVIMFSSIISFSDVYDGGLRDFFVLYNYIIFGIMFLSTLMGYEGNYIDGLMSRKESIYSLLRAKYILYSIALLIPTILMIPGMVTGKVSVLGCIAWLIFIPGAVYCCLFQLAVYNNKTTDLNSKNYTIGQGDMLGLVGNNGAGKTTLFRLILDLLQADLGNVTINDIDVSKSEDWKNFTGAFIDDGFLIDYLTPEEYFYFIGKMYGLKKEEVDERLLPFERFMNGEVMGQKKFIRNYSAGNKQKIGIISAMLHHPQLLILDEPFNFLDPSSQSVIKHLLKRYNEEHGATVIISSHNLNHTVDVCPRIALLENGVIIRDIRNENNSAEQELEAYFNVGVEEEAVVEETVVEVEAEAAVEEITEKEEKNAEA